MIRPRNSRPCAGTAIFIFDRVGIRLVYTPTNKPQNPLHINDFKNVPHFFGIFKTSPGWITLLSFKPFASASACA